MWVCRTLLAVCLLLPFAVGCFGDNDGANAPQIVDISAPTSVDAEGGSASITVFVRGRAHEQLSIALAGDLGTFEPASHLVITDANGEASLVTRFTAGDVAGDESAIANVSDLSGERSSRRFAFSIVPLTRVGEVAQLPSSEPADLTSLEGQAIAITTPGTLRRVGIYSADTVEVVVGIYAESAGEPTTLVANASATLTPGVNELAVTATTLPVGTYWFMANYRTAVDLYIGTAMVPTKYVSRAFSTPLPATYPMPMTYTDAVRNYYLVLGR